MTVLGALEALYVPLEVREQVPEKAQKAVKLGIYGDASKIGSKLDLAKSLEAGRIVSRYFFRPHFPKKMLRNKLHFTEISAALILSEWPRQKLRNT